MEILNKYSTPNDFEYLFLIFHLLLKQGKVFDYNNELPESPLYTNSQPSEEMGNTPGEKHELGLPNHRPIEPLSVYAVPNKNRSRHQMTNSRDVYAQGYK